MQSGFYVTDGVQTATTTLRLLVDGDDNSNQAAGNAHRIEAWADDPSTGTNLFTAEVLNNTVAFYSTHAGTKTLGTSTDRWSTAYAVNVDASGYYTSGAHGQAVAANDIAAGSGTGNYVWWDDNVATLTLAGNPSILRVLTTGGAGDVVISHLSGAAGFGGIGCGVAAGPITTANYTLIGEGTNTYLNAPTGGSLLFRINNANRATLDGAGRFTVLDASSLTRFVVAPASNVSVFYDSAGAISTAIYVAGVNTTVFNEQGNDIDHRIEGDTNAFLTHWDAGNDTVGVGAAALSTTRLYTSHTITATSGNRWSGSFDITSNHAANSTGALIGIGGNASHAVAFNLTSLFGLNYTVTTTSGFSAGTLTRGSCIDLNITHDGAGAVADFYGLRVQAPTKGGSASTPTRFAQILLADTGAFATTNMGIRQQGTNAHNRFQGGATFGADAAMTTGFVVDCVGDLRASGGVSIGSGTATVADGELRVGGWGNFGTTTASTTSGEFATGLLAAGRMVFTPLTGLAQPRWALYGTDNAIHVEFVLNAAVDVEASYYVFNEQGAKQDFRVEGDTLSHMLFLNGSDAALENIALLTNSLPNFQSGDRIVFWGDATTAPTGNPASGIFAWSEGGAGKGRGGGGTVTTYIPSAEHCRTCGYDFWDVMAENARWGASIRKCGWCGRVYKRGPATVHHLLTEQQQREYVDEAA